MSAHVALVVGAARPGNRTSEVARLAADHLTAAPGVTVDILEPGALGLPLPGTGADTEAVRCLRARLDRADAVLLATPEYQGSFSSILKLALEHLGWPAEIKGKPVGLLGVAAGRIGAIKSLEHLRSVAAHLGAHVLPQPVSIAGVNDALDERGQLRDDGVREALATLCDDLVLAAFGGAR